MDHLAKSRWELEKERNGRDESLPKRRFFNPTADDGTRAEKPPYIVGSDGYAVRKKQYAVAAALVVMMGEHGEGARVFGRLWHGRVGKTNPCAFFVC